MAKPSQGTQYQHRTAGTAPLAKMADPQKSDPTRSRSRDPKAKTARDPTIEPTTATSPTGHNGRNHRGRRNETSAEVPTADQPTLTIAITTAQRRRRRSVRPKPPHGKTPAGHERANLGAGRHQAHAGRNSKIGGDGNCSSTGP